jgi:LPS export ABC transporter protein LptC
LAAFISVGGIAYKVVETVSSGQREIQKNPLKALNYLPESALHLKDFRRAKIENGRKVWEVMGEEADYYKDQKEAVIKRPRFIYYDRNGAAVETAGEVARMFLGDKDLEKLQIEGGIKVQYEDYVLKSEEAIYLPAQQRILLPKRTTVVGGGFEVEGSSMEVELESRIIRLLQRVKSKIEPEKMKNAKKESGAKQVSGE